MSAASGYPGFHMPTSPCPARRLHPRMSGCPACCKWAGKAPPAAAAAGWPCCRSSGWQGRPCRRRRQGGRSKGCSAACCCRIDRPRGSSRAPRPPQGPRGLGVGRLEAGRGVWSGWAACSACVLLGGACQELQEPGQAQGPACKHGSELSVRPPGALGLESCVAGYAHRLLPALAAPHPAPPVIVLQHCSQLQSRGAVRQLSPAAAGLFIPKAHSQMPRLRSPPPLRPRCCPSPRCLRRMPENATLQ